MDSEQRVPLSGTFTKEVKPLWDGWETTGHERSGEEANKRSCANLAIRSVIIGDALILVQFVFLHVLVFVGL